MERNNKKILFAIVFIALVVIVAVVLVRRHSTQTAQTASQNSKDQSQALGDQTQGSANANVAQDSNTAAQNADPGSMQALSNEQQASSTTQSGDIASFAASQQKTSAKQDQGKSIPIPKDQTAQIDVAVGNVAYENDQLGFKLMLPSGWDKYKADAQDGKIEISLPTTDASFNGYAPVVDILTFTTDAWNSYLSDCQKNPSPNCYGAQSITAKSDKYVFIVTTADGSIPQDLSPMNGGLLKGDYVGAIIKSFQTL